MRVVAALLCLLSMCALGAPAAAEPMTFKRAAAGPGGPATVWIAAEGEIADKTADEFKAFLARERIASEAAVGGFAVYLNSAGGSVRGAIRLGYAIRAAGFDTRVAGTLPKKDAPRFDAEAPGRCYSACAIAFLGGQSRNAATRTLGIQHSELAPGPAERAEETARLLAVYV